MCSARSNTSIGTAEAVARAASDWSGAGPASPPLAGEPWPPRADRPRWLLLPLDDGVPMMAASTAAKGGGGRLALSLSTLWSLGSNSEVGNRNISHGALAIGLKRATRLKTIASQTWGSQSTGDETKEGPVHLQHEVPCPVTPLLRCEPRMGATTVSSMGCHIWRRARNIPPGSNPSSNRGWPIIRNVTHIHGSCSALQNTYISSLGHDDASSRSGRPRTCGREMS